MVFVLKRQLEKMGSISLLRTYVEGQITGGGPKQTDPRGRTNIRTDGRGSLRVFRLQGIKKDSVSIGQCDQCKTA